MWWNTKCLADVLMLWDPKIGISPLLSCFFTRRVGRLKPVGRQYQMLYVAIFGAGFPSDNNLYIVFQQAVIVSVSSIQNIVMVTLLLQFMFSVIGVQLFKVQYFSFLSSYFIKYTVGCEVSSTRTIPCSNLFSPFITNWQPNPLQCLTELWLLSHNTQGKLFMCTDESKSTEAECQVEKYLNYQILWGDLYVLIQDISKELRIGCDC